MKHGPLTLQMEHYWHCSSGQAGEGDLDLLPRTEPCGLPIAPGRTLRGRLKWAGRELGWDEAKLTTVFGQEDARELTSIGRVHVPSATMRGPFADYCRAFYLLHGHPAPQTEALFEDIAATATENGVARNKSLRRIRYAVPVDLVADIEVSEDSIWPLVEECVKHLRAIGKGKHDGYGWCMATLVEAAAAGKPVAVAPAKTFDVTITLQDDVILSATSATAGAHRTLDYVPGSALMGVAARRMFENLRTKHGPMNKADAECEGARALAEARISFGNGYVAPGGAKAMLPVPLAWHYGKDADKDPEKLPSPVKDGLLVPDAIWNLGKVRYEESDLQGKQPVQMRDGWFDPDTGAVIKTVSTTETLKTAVSPDREDYETARETALFGYEAVAAGTQFRSRIEVPSGDPDLCKLVEQTFSGTTIRLGRSKGSEFGRAKATVQTAEDVSAPSVTAEAIFLCESDLALVDANGFPRLKPEANDFFDIPKDWELCKERCHLRFRRYSLWNALRGGPDVERQVISKGSVIVFKQKSGGNAATVKLRTGTGQSEGLGRVLLNPGYLQDKQPRLSIKPSSPDNATTTSEAILDTSDPLTLWVLDRYKVQRFDIDARKLAEPWVTVWKNAQRAAKVTLHASQWMRLDEAARRSKTVPDLLIKLGTPGKADPNTIFGHGKRSEVWTQTRGNGTSVAQAVITALNQAKTDEAHLHLAAFRAAVNKMAGAARKAQD